MTPPPREIAGGSTPVPFVPEPGVGTRLAVATPLVDRFGRPHTYLRISVTDRCNFRCGYCMPPEGLDWRPAEQILTIDEIVRVARVFARVGVTKVRITGGEPTVRQGVVDLVARIGRIEGIQTVGITTNGYRLAAMAADLRAAGVHRLNISLDSLRRDRFQQITRRDVLPAVLRGIDAALGAGFHSIQLNTVVMAGVNEDELLSFVELARSQPLSVRFIEFMPFKGNGWQVAGVYPYAQMRADIERVHTLLPEDGEGPEVAKEFRIDGFLGRVGFITSMSQSFCATCNRIRLTADGQVKSCLFSPAESDLRSLLRSGADDDALEERIRHALSLKQWEHAPMEVLQREENRSMVEIGG